MVVEVAAPGRVAKHLAAVLLRRPDHPHNCHRRRDRLQLPLPRRRRGQPRLAAAVALATTAGAYCDYETVAFDAADPRQPTLLMLPAGCHVLAPLRIAPGGAFSTEFGAVLPAGESFGWKGFVGADGDGDGEELDDEAATAAAQAGQGVSESASARLVRVQRLYDGSRFVSGTTSLSSVE